MYSGAQTHRVTAFLIFLSVASLLLLVLDYPIRFTLFVLPFIGSVLHVATSWVINQIVTLSILFLPLLYPAVVVALIGIWIGKQFKVDDRQLFEKLHIQRHPANFLKFVLSIMIGQLTWFILPSPLRLFTLIVAIVLHYNSNLDNDQPRNVAPVVNENVCVVCMANPKIMLIQPCKHFCVCENCIHLLNECPICRGEIEESERIFPQ